MPTADTPTADPKPPPSPSLDALKVARDLWLNGLHGARCEHGPYQQCPDCQKNLIALAIDTFAASQREQVERELVALRGMLQTERLEAVVAERDAARAEVERLERENFKLAAYQCAEPTAGEGGSVECEVVKRLERALRELVKAVSMVLGEGRDGEVAETLILQNVDDAIAAARKVLSGGSE